jgi:hypothetical protein
MSSNTRNVRPGAHTEPLDAIDERLLAALVDDARISNKQLAELVGIAPSTALMRTRALSERGIVQGFEAKLSLSAAPSCRPVHFPHLGLGGLPAAYRGRQHRGPPGLGAGQPGDGPRRGPH